MRHTVFEYILKKSIKPFKWTFEGVFKGVVTNFCHKADLDNGFNLCLLFQSLAYQNILGIFFVVQKYLNVLFDTFIFRYDDSSKRTELFTK